MTNTTDKESDSLNLPILPLITKITELIHSARATVVYNINTLQVRTNFEIGRLIVEYEQGGSERAEYGKKT
ncbi:MAG: DUF1016 domain-containing protein, partial [Methanomicrobiales archaeon]|nr:DUF1016 domain-containing protein [Methanomicrobiales archaeon]